MTADEFIKDVTHHAMTIRLDDKLYRHLVFRHPGSSNQWFEIVTWPGSLTIHGDMGTWSFSRVDDMFTFFRQDGPLKINAGYWHEKITAESRFGGPAKKFNAETFKSNVLSSLEGYRLTDERRAEIAEALEEDVFNEEDESKARRNLADFENHKFCMYDTWEISGDAFVYHYLWCLYAIVWAIQQYDSVKAAESLEDVR